MGQDLLFVEDTESRKPRHTTLVVLLWMSDRPDPEPLPNNTQHSHETDNHADGGGGGGGIQNRNPSMRSFTNPRIRPRDHLALDHAITLH